MASLNQVSIIGYLGDEPKIISTQSGRKVASLRVATTEKGFTRQDGTQVADKTEWHTIVVFGKIAEVAEKYLHKGGQVFVQGRILSRQYEKNGEKRVAVEIIADTLQLLDRKTVAQPAQAVSADPYSDSPLRQGKSIVQDDSLPF